MVRAPWTLSSNTAGRELPSPSFLLFKRCPRPRRHPILHLPSGWNTGRRALLSEMGGANVIGSLPWRVTSIRFSIDWTREAHVGTRRGQPGSVSRPGPGAALEEGDPLPTPSTQCTGWRQKPSPYSRLHFVRHDREAGQGDGGAETVQHLLHPGPSTQRLNMRAPWGQKQKRCFCVMLR